MRNVHVERAIVGLVLSGCSALAWAQTGGGGSLEEIVVTARKRAESIQDVPVSVTAVGEAAMERNFIARIENLQRITPNVTLEPVSITTSSLAPYIRGIGNRVQEPVQDPAIAISVDGVYLASIVGSAIDVFDVEQIEVLRGPQGTLQGRNSPGGAINIRTRRPGDDLGMRLEASYGNYDTYSVKAAIDGPLVPNLLGAKLAVMTSQSDGYMRNITTGERLSGQDTVAARLGFLITPTDSLNIYLTADYMKDESPQRGLRNVASSIAGLPGQPNVLLCDTSATGLAFLGQCVTEDKYKTSMEFTEPNDLEVWGVTANVDWQLPNGLQLTSITGYRDADEFQSVDVDGTGLPLLTSIGRSMKVDQFSQEIRLSSDRSGVSEAGQLDWVVGVYYVDSSWSLDQPIDAFGSIIPGRRAQDMESYAGFGQATYHITDRWSVSLGGRQTKDKKDLDITFFSPTEFIHSVDGDSSNFSLEAGTEFRFSPDILGYFRFAQGYRSGGINGDVPTPDAAVEFDSEEVDSYELGMKAEWLNQRLRTNVSLFWTDYDNLQRDVVITIPTAPFFAQVIQNQGKARIRGVDLELLARPVDRLTLSATVGYLDAEFRDTNQQMPFAPDWTGFFGADYEIPLGTSGSLTASADIQYRGDANINGALQPIGDQKSYTLANAALTFRTEDGRYSVTGYVRNIFDKYYIVAAEAAAGVSAWVVPGAPRTYGVRFTAKY
jgi:iron complex outermembrane receptor protein